MAQVKKYGPLLEPTEFEFENVAVLNPGCFQEGKTVHLLYRAVDQEHKSSIGYARLEGPTQVAERWNKPVIYRDYPYESKGVEDPRVVKLGNDIYVFYVAHDGENALTAYALLKDFEHFKTLGSAISGMTPMIAAQVCRRHFQKMGIISAQMTYEEVEKTIQGLQLKDAYFFFASYYEDPDNSGPNTLLWSKDMFIFPKKINNQFVLVHRILPDIQLVFFSDFAELTLAFWRQYLKQLPNYVMLENKHWFETRHVGGGCPPIETDDGWLLIFHTSESRNIGRVYHACAALLDKENPLKVIGRLHEPLFSPTEEWEKTGFVSNVVFPTGTAIFGDELYIYYGAADKRIAAVSVNIKELIAEMKDPSKGHRKTI